MKYIYSRIHPGTKINKILNFLEQSLLDQPIKDEYNFIHLGLIQVVARPTIDILNLYLLIYLYWY